MRTGVGLLEVTSVEQVDEINEEDARRAGAEATELLRLMAGKAPAPIWRIGLRFAGADPRVELRSRVELAADERVALLERLDRFDAASRHGPWARQVLALIRTHPGRRAPDLAAELGRETGVRSESTTYGSTLPIHSGGERLCS